MITPLFGRIRSLKSDYKVLAIGIATFLFILGLSVGSNPQNSPAGRYLLHTWRSIKKFSNIVYLPVWINSESDFPEYRLIIDADNWKEIEDSLPINPDLTHGQLSEDNKSYVNGYFSDPKSGYQSEVDIRYRGLMSNNWEYEKKSLRIKFPKDNLFEGVRALNLMIPEDRDYYLEMLNIYRAKKLGLFSPEFKFTRVYINNRDFGVYLAAEAWSTELLSKNGIIDTNNIFSNKDEVGVDIDNIPAFTNWKSYTAKIEDGPFEELEALNKLTNEAPDDQFNRIVGDLVDLDKVYRWQLINVLAGSAHQSYFSNFVLIFKKETGKFEPIPWNVEFKSLSNKLYDDNLPLLVRRIFRNKNYSDQFLDLLKSYLADEGNLTDDLAYYDKLYVDTKRDFYKDNAKNQSNFEFNRAVKEGEILAIDNFNTAKALVEGNRTEAVIWEKKNYSKISDLPGSFQYLDEISLDFREFLTRNPIFRRNSNGTIGIGPGVFVISKNIVVPKNSRLVLEPGTQLYFYPKTSLISYSPVTALGQIKAPIVFAPAFGNAEPWGAFGVINTGSQKNYFSYLRVSGGSAWEGSVNRVINGVPFISQFSLRNADSEIYNSIFENSYSDDAFHAIGGSVLVKNSVFRNTFADAIDLDTVKNSKIIGNVFYNLDVEKNHDDGDAMDISGAQNLEIMDNHISKFKDKCISVGERAEAVIKNNIMSNCNYGLAVKDDSHVIVDNSVIISNRTGGLTLYRKKQAFVRGGHAEITNSILWGNPAEILIDETAYVPTKSGVWKEIERAGISKLSIKDSTVESGYEGVNISLLRPDFKSILPAFIYNSVKLD